MFKVLLFLLSIIPCVFFAQEGNKLNGIIKELNTGTAIEGVYIKLLPTEQTAVSNSFGFFEINNIPNGHYTLVVTLMGYQKIKKDINITSDLHFNFNLKENIEHLSEIVVTGTRTKKTITNSPIITYVIKDKDIENSGVTTVLEAIELAMPNVHFSPDPHGDNLQMQGLSNDYIQVLIDGQRLVGEMRGNVDFSRIPLANIKQIEVINGASSVLYGSNAIGGVINIITKDSQNKSSVTIESRYGSYGEILTQLSGGSHIKNTDFSVSFYRKSHNGYDLSPYTSPNSYTFNPFNDISGDIGVRQKINQKIKLKVNMRYFQHHLNNPKVSFEKEHKFTNAYTGGIYLDTQISNKNTLEIQLHKDYAQRFSITDINNSKDKRGHYDYNSLQVIDKQEIGERNLILVGFEYSYENVFSTNFLKLDGREHSVGTYNGFVQADFYIAKRLEAIVGGRYTYHQNYGNVFTPSLSLMYKWKHLVFRTNVAKGYRSPSLKEMYYNFDHEGFWIIGNSKLKPEKSLYTSLSGEYSKKNIHFTLNVFQNNINNKIHYFMSDNTDRAEMHYRNYEETQIKGIEINSKYYLSNFNAQLGYIYTNAEDTKTGLQIGGNVKHSMNLILGWESKQLKNPISVHLSSRINSGKVYENVVSRYSPEAKKYVKILIENNQGWYNLWRFNASKTIKMSSQFNITAFIGVNNIGNYTDDFLITPGRTYYGGLKLKIK